MGVVTIALLDEIKSLAQQINKYSGPWFVSEYRGSKAVVDSGNEVLFRVEGKAAPGLLPFIARLDKDTILTLIAYIEDLESKMNALLDEVNEMS